MNNESILIEKSYYKTLIDKDSAANPMLIISEYVLQEQNQDIPELSNLRFAQGELYYLYRDYEAAIFKWEQVTNELEPWAKKNMADAYFAVDLYSTAEEIYKSIQSDSITLNTEVGLQLFTLYIRMKKINSADQTIKKVVRLNPDDEQVTSLARNFFEEQMDWDSAVDLAMNEAMRTESIHWYNILQAYIEDGVTKHLDPAYFYPALRKLYDLNDKRFEELAVALWHSYQGEASYLTWVQGFNDLLQDFEITQKHSYPALAVLYKDAYFEFINGEKSVKSLKTIVPSLLRNWVRLTDRNHALLASSSVLAWNDHFPTTLSSEDVGIAEHILSGLTYNRDGLEDSVRLFETIDKWAMENGLAVSERHKWIMDELLDLNVQRLMIAGTSGNGKSALIHSLLGEDSFDQPTATTVLYKYGEEEDVNEVSDSSIIPLNHEEIEERVTSRAWMSGPPRIIDYKLPSAFLKENGIAIIDTPGFSIANSKTQEVRRYLHMADSLLFVLDVNDPFSQKERELALMIKEQAPDLPIHFLLNKMDLVHNDQEAIRIVDEAWKKINPYLPEAKIFAHSARYRGAAQRMDFTEFLQGNLLQPYKESKRTMMLLHYVREAISSLLDQRLEREEELADSIHKNEDLLSKLKAALNQVDDLEKEKAAGLRNSFKARKDDIRNDVVSAIPKILQASKDLLVEDSDYRKIHIELNEKMNRRVQEYLETTVLPKYFYSMQEWIREADIEFKESQGFLTEMTDGFNAIYQDDRVKMNCDFRVLDDWRRDSNRMTSGIQMDTVNILLRHTPQQLLLKSAGVLFGSIANKSLMYNKYTNLIETQDYTEVAEVIADKFLLQFEMFEKSITRDVAMFFSNPKEMLNTLIADANGMIEKYNRQLEKMRAKPEMYRDPLKLFELRLRQYEWMVFADREFQTVS
ncbi:GTP-binding protein [Pradoshia eiseniae]|uniref:GTP-binding protein n=1 Tax=Pradoshia eiseniae TaxID=2064768 RepID=A0A2S7MYB8_9BACI|nr:dynamin family protein [Pradoshia eiseniae]PQD94766.1 GTP-binding protein [Pradoshia eiseniae]